MENQPPNATPDPGDEITAWVLKLREAQQRLQELTGGGIDAVLQAGGQSYLLQDAQERLRQSEEQFRNMFNSAATGIAVSTPQGRFLNANPSYCRMLGYTLDELLELNFAALTHPDDLALNIQMRDELLAGQRESFLMEKRYLKKNGDIVWTRHSVSAAHSAGGEITSLMVVAEDITERKQAEEELALFRTLVDRSPDAIEVIDPETGRFLAVNSTGCARLGYSLEEMLSMKLADIDVEKDYRSLWPVVVEEIKKTGFATIIGRHRRKDGSTFPVEVNARYIDLNRGYMVAVVRDITDRKRSEARIRRLIDSNVQGVFFWKTNGQIFEANDALLAMVGHTREDLEAGRMSWTTMTPPEYADLDRRALAETRAKGACAPYEKEYLRKDGTRVPILIGAAMFDDEPDDGVCFVLDLTERKKLEQQFLRAQRMESVGTLAGGIAHDLNNILAPIMMSIELLKEMAQNPQVGEILATIEVSAKRGAEIVRQVLSFARGMEGERMEVQPKHLLQDIETIIKDTFPKNIHREFSLPNNLWKILGDPTQLHQILLNLCVNARDAMPEGGKLTISVENVVLDQQYAAMHLLAKAGSYVCINVTDSGTGIPPAILEKIFEPFFTTKEVGKGTGLGLSTVMAIVKSHGGFINAYSEPGKGSTFKVYLPATDVSLDERRDTLVTPAPPRGNGETILMVDDEASILTITGQTLEAFGYRILTAVDGTEALALYAQHRDRIAVVLTDMAMPIMDGAATIRALRKMNPAIKIIAASGLNSNGGATKVSGEGVKYFLTKPYTAGTLLNAVRAILDET